MILLEMMIIFENLLYIIGIKLLMTNIWLLSIKILFWDWLYTILFEITLILFFYISTIFILEKNIISSNMVKLKLFIFIIG